MSPVAPGPPQSDFPDRPARRECGDAPHLAGLRMIVQTRRPAIALSHRRPLRRIVFRVGGARPLTGKPRLQTLNQVEREDTSDRSSVLISMRIPHNPRRRAGGSNSARCPARRVLINSHSDGNCTIRVTYDLRQKCRRGQCGKSRRIEVACRRSAKNVGHLSRFVPASR